MIVLLVKVFNMRTRSDVLAEGLFRRERDCDESWVQITSVSRQKSQLLDILRPLFGGQQALRFLFTSPLVLLYLQRVEKSVRGVVSLFKPVNFKDADCVILLSQLRLADVYLRHLPALADDLDAAEGWVQILRSVLSGVKHIDPRPGAGDVSNHLRQVTVLSPKFALCYAMGVRPLCIRGDALWLNAEVL